MLKQEHIPINGKDYVQVILFDKKTGDGYEYKTELKYKKGV